MKNQHDMILDFFREMMGTISVEELIMNNSLRNEIESIMDLLRQQVAE